MAVDKKLEDLVNQSYDVVKEIFDAPSAARAHMMATKGKLAINVMNHYKTLRQADGGQEQARAVIGRMLCGTKDELLEFVQNNLPEIKIPKKLLEGGGAQE